MDVLVKDCDVTKVTSSHSATARDPRWTTCSLSGHFFLRDTDTLCDVTKRGDGTSVAVLVQHAILEESGSDGVNRSPQTRFVPGSPVTIDSECRWAPLSNFCFCFLQSSPTLGNRQKQSNCVFLGESVTTGEFLTANATRYRYEPGCGHDDGQERVNGALEVAIRNLSVVKGR